VLELGSGCGLVGLRLAALGAHVVMTDVPQVLELTCRNVQANLAVISSGSVCTEPLTWGQPLSERLVSLKTCEGFDWVVGSDIVYHEHLFDSLASTLRDVCGSKSQILLCHEDRRVEIESDFFSRLAYHFSSSLVCAG